LFEVEKIALEKMPGLKRGKKKKVPKMLSDAVHTSLKVWRDTELINTVYPSTQIISGSVLLGDDVIEQLATCGERIMTGADLKKHTRWYLGIDSSTGDLTVPGNLLLLQLQNIYATLDAKEAEDAAVLANLPTTPSTVPASTFYGNASSRSGQ
jgi:hypothetical protein